MDKQHQEQVERLKAEQLRVTGWLSQYVADLKAAKQQVKFDPLEELVGEVQKFKEGQEKLEEAIVEQISAAAIQRGLFGSDVGL